MEPTLTENRIYVCVFDTCGFHQNLYLFFIIFCGPAKPYKSTFSGPVFSSTTGCQYADSAETGVSFLHITFEYFRNLFGCKFSIWEFIYKDGRRLMTPPYTVGFKEAEHLV